MGLACPRISPVSLSPSFQKNRQENLVFLDFNTYWKINPVANGTVAVASDMTLIINPDHGWKEVDDTLSNCELFPKLQYVRVLCTPGFVGQGRAGEPSEEQEVFPQVQAKAMTALHRTNARVSTLAVGAEGTAATMRACSLATSLVPEKYKSAGSFEKQPFSTRRFA